MCNRSFPLNDTGVPAGTELQTRSDLVKLTYEEGGSSRFVTRRNRIVDPIQTDLIAGVDREERRLLDVCRCSLAAVVDSRPQLANTECWIAESVVVACDVLRNNCG